MRKNAWQLSHSIQAVLFDCDGTLSHIEGIDELADMNGVGKEVKALTDYAMTQVGITKELFQQRMSLIKPTQQQIKKVGEMYYAKRTMDIDAVIRVLQSLGKTIYILSAGLNPAVKDFAQKLNVPESNVFAVDVFFDEKGNYVDYDHQAYVANKDGKRTIVELLKKQHERLLYVGDGMNDMVVYDLVDRFVGYGGSYYRETIASKCDFYIKASTMSPLLPLALTQEEVEKLNPDMAVLYDAGVNHVGSTK